MPLCLALTMGDPAGIGLDITAKIWSERASNTCPPFLFYGDPAALDARAKVLGLSVPIAIVADPTEAHKTFPAALPVAPTPTKLDQKVVAGEANSAHGAGIIASIEAAAIAVKTGAASAIVTNPISKAVLYTAGFTHPGHTEFLGELSARLYPGQDYSPIMMLVADDLRVIPLTIHIPLSDVPAAITDDLIIATAKTALKALQQDFAIAQPRIAFAGLNPHAGEDGAMGREEIEVIAPALAKLRALGFAISGPHPADTLFHDAARATYDAVIAMYHDQALIPLKTLAFDRGVNVTLGLPFIRTSPDHGTAFAIAGSGKASPDSLLAALQLAATLAERRAARCND